MPALIRADFYQPTYFGDSPISDLDYVYRIPRFKCEHCGSDSTTSRFAYPHLDPSTVLSLEELRIIDGRKPEKASDDKIANCLGQLRARWRVPVTAGTSFGPVRIKVSARPKDAFDALPLHSALFLRRGMAERLKAEGFVFDYVLADAYGRYAAEADLVQLCAPTAGRLWLPPSITFCSHCLRHSPHERLEPILYDTDAIRNLPFFATLEAGKFMLSSTFVGAAVRLGASGLGPKTLWPASVRPGPAPAAPIFEGTGMRVPPIQPRDSSGRRGKKSQTSPTTKREINPAFVSAWLRRLRGFLDQVRLMGGCAAFATGGESKMLFSKPHGLPGSLSTLLTACGGKLSFKYSLDLKGQEFSGGLEVDTRLLKRHKRECAKWANETWIADEPEEKSLWLNSRPFASLPNGDYLGLGDWSQESNPPVVYLCHDDSSQVLAQDLASFLEIWAGLGYIGPEISILDHFIDNSTGMLDASTLKAERLRDVFRSAEQKGTS